jgi:hypothetical protein
MTSNRDDLTVREAIRELRRPDERDVPAFDAVLTHTRRDVSWPIGRLAFLVGVLILSGIGLARTARRSNEFTVSREVVALSTWQPITDVLLDTPTRAFLTQTRTIDSTFSASRVPLPRSQ